jgi:hypothetical protein
VTDPANPNHIYAAVAPPSLANTAAGLGSTSVYVSSDGGATWSAVFAAGQSGGTINNTSQTAVKIAAGPGGTLAAAVIDLGAHALTGLFYSTNSGISWTAVCTENSNPDVMMVNPRINRHRRWQFASAGCRLCSEKMLIGGTNDCSSPR